MCKLVSTCIIAIAVLSCSPDEPPIDCQKSGLFITLDLTTNATSCDTNDGKVQVTTSGGKQPYSFFLNDEPIETAQFSTLKAGTYSILVMDANHCTSSVDNVTILATDFSFSTTLQANTSCLSGNGSVAIDVTGNNIPYTYKLGNGNFTSANLFSGLVSGNHSISVKDDNDCIVNLTITIPRGFTGTSWEHDIKPILTTHCATSGCHNGVSRSNDFREYASVKSFAKSIKSNTQDRSMPFDASLTQNQINMIACWVDDGAFQN